MKMVIIIIRICFKSYNSQEKCDKSFFYRIFNLYIYIYFFYLKRFERDIVEKGKQWVRSKT